MTRKEELARASKDYHLKRHPNFTFGEYVAFIDGAQWADQHPHWISVEDELPPRWETNPNVSVPVITFGTFGESGIPFVELQRYHFGDGRWLYGKPTHWMPFQFPKKGGNQ